MSYEGSRRSQQPRLPAGKLVQVSESAIAPGKRMRTMGIPLRPAGAEPPAQRKPASVSGAAYQSQAELTARWLDTAVRPDLHPPPIQRSKANSAPSTVEPCDCPGDSQKEAPHAPSPRGYQARSKLDISTPHDPLEREADKVADAVLHMPEASTPGSGAGDHGAAHLFSRTSESAIQRMCAACDNERENKEDSHASLDEEIQNLDGRGQALSAADRSFFEPRFGHDFSNVRIHTDERAGHVAQMVNARAFTMGANIVFAPGEAQSRQLTAHELAHVVQQGQAKRLEQGKNPSPRDAVAESRAASLASRPDTMAARSLQRSRGDCTDSEHRQLQAEVNERCKNRPRGCSGTHSLAELEERIANNAACIAARQRINHRCFRGGDAGHQEAVMGAVNALRICHRHRDRLRAREQQQDEPIIEPGAARRVGIATSVGAGLGMVIGGILGAVGGGAGGTLVAPGVGTVGGGIAGGAAGAAEGAAIGGLAGGAIMGGAQALWEWLSD